MASQSYCNRFNNDKFNINPSYYNKDSRPVRNNCNYNNYNYNNYDYNNWGYNNYSYDCGYNQPPYNNNY